MNKSPKQVRELDALAQDLHGVFSIQDLSNFFNESRPTALRRYIEPYLADGTLERYARGWYLWDNARIDILASRMSPGCVLSFGSALAYHLVIGTVPAYQVDAVHLQREKLWEGRFQLAFHHLAEEQLQPYVLTPLGVRIATAEKAVLDTLYFILRGKKYPFDLYQDINRALLNEALFQELLSTYRNPRFRTFANGWFYNEV
jgi:predicted transcriptional regulator of viral defense system